MAIGVLGTSLARVLDRLADRTGLGEAFVGAVMLGACTSLPGITASVTAAWDGYPVMSLANALGGIAAQTAFLAIADMAYRKVNLEHAAASVPNMMQGVLLIILLAFTVLAMVGPDIDVLGVHPITPVLFVVYLAGMRMVYKTKSKPMWHPRMTTATRLDEPEEPEAGETLGKLWVGFAISAVVVVVAGWLVTRTGEAIGARAGLSDSVMGALFIAVATSLPELVTSVAAVRRGALTMAVGGVIGGNAFDSLFAAVADLFYRPGGLYTAATEYEISLAALVILMTAVLLLGLLRREKTGFANIGFESVAVLVLYLLGLVYFGFSM